MELVENGSVWSRRDGNRTHVAVVTSSTKDRDGVAIIEYSLTILSQNSTGKMFGFTGNQRQIEEVHEFVDKFTLRLNPEEL